MVKKRPCPQRPSPSGASFGSRQVRLGIKKRPKPVSVPARKVRLGNKQGAFYSQDGASCGQER